MKINATLGLPISFDQQLEVNTAEVFFFFFNGTKKIFWATKKKINKIKRVSRARNVYGKRRKKKRSRNVLIKLINTFWCLHHRNLPYCCDVFLSFVSSLLDFFTISFELRFVVFFIVMLSSIECFAYSVNLT